MIVDRLDPALRQFAATRTDLSASVLGVVRDSLNQRRAEASRDVNTVGVDIENREARSIPVRIYRGGPAPAPAVTGSSAGAALAALLAQRAADGTARHSSRGCNATARFRQISRHDVTYGDSLRQLARDGGEIGVDVRRIDHPEETV